MGVLFAVPELVAEMDRIFADKGRGYFTLYAEGEAPAQRFLSPRGEDIDERAVSNSFVGALTAALSARKPMPEAIEAALAKATSPQAQAAS